MKAIGRVKRIYEQKYLWKK